MQVFKSALAIFAAAAFVSGASSPVSAETWPNRFVTMIVPYPAGGPTDILARAVAIELTEKLGQQFLIENRSGAGGNVGTAAVAKAAPDGYTILFGTSGPISVNKFMYKNVTFDSERDLAPIVLVSKLPVLFVNNPASPLNDFGQLIAHAKAHPRTLNIAIPGYATVCNIASEMLQMLGGMKWSSVPYRGSSPIIADLLSQNIDAAADLISSHIPLLNAGKLRPLAVTSSDRLRTLPNVPTVSESGFPGFEASSWNALMAPAGTPPEVIEKVNAIVNAYLKGEKGSRQLANLEMQVAGSTPQDLAAFISSEMTKWGPIIKSANISAE